MKILFLTRWYLPFSGIFIGRHAQAVARYNELVVLAVLPGEKNSGPETVTEGNVQEPGFTVIRYFYKPSSCPIAMAARLFNLLKFISRSFAGYRYAAKQFGSFDIIHVHILTRAAISGFIISLFTRTPYIISEHWTRYIPENWGFTGLLRRMLTRMIVRNAAAVTTVSGFLKSAMEDCGLRNEKFVVIPNAVDTTLFIPAVNSAFMPKKRILHVSNFHERAKNLHGMLRAIKILRSQRQDFEVLFVGGDEPALSHVRKYASDLGLASPDVVFTGPIPAEKLAGVYRGSAFLLMFSNFESFSIVIPEAMACGLPVLATAAGGIPEYFSSKAGRLIPPGDEATLLENMNFMLDNYRLFDPEYSERFVENTFGLNTVGRQFDELYKSVLNRQVIS